MSQFRFIFTNLGQDPRVGGVYRRFSGESSWVYKLAAGAAALVIVVPLVMLLLAAVAAFVFVVAVGTLVHRVSRGLERLFGPRPPRDAVMRSQDATRRNVRVIYPGQQ